MGSLMMPKQEFRLTKEQEELLESLLPSLRSLTFSYLRNKNRLEEFDDMTQHVSIKLAYAIQKKLGRLEEPNKQHAYFQKVIKLSRYNYWKYCRMRITRDEQWGPEQDKLPCEASFAEDLTEKLPYNHWKYVIRSIYGIGTAPLKHVVIAQDLGVTEKESKALAYNARRFLRTKLQKDIEYVRSQSRSHRDANEDTQRTSRNRHTAPGKSKSAYRTPGNCYGKTHRCNRNTDWSDRSQDRRVGA